MSATAKRRTNVTIDAATLDAARELGLNVSAVSEAALIEAVRQARAASWAARNAEALAQRRAWLDDNGLPLAKWQLWQPE
ncbi:MAG: type II toxin-antitoxin system CcdA family antitoxin [Pseudodonghicola sp.]